MQLLLYLDQAYWSDLTHPSHSLTRRRLEALVEDGRLLCPASPLHLVETAQAQRAETRRDTTQLLRELSLGTQLPLPNALWKLEWRAVQEGLGPDWVREQVLREPAVVRVVETLELLCFLDGFDPSELGRRVREAMAASVDVLNAELATWEIVRATMADWIGVVPSEIAASRDELVERFPSQGVNLALLEASREKTSRPLTPNDLFDFAAVAWTIRYFDIVTTDRASGARVIDAEQSGGLPSQRAVVVRLLRDLPAALDSCGL